MMSDQDMNAAVKERNYFGNGTRATISRMLGYSTSRVVMIFSDINGCYLNFFVGIAYWKLTLSCMFI